MIAPGLLRRGLGATFASLDRTDRIIAATAVGLAVLGRLGFVAVALELTRGSARATIAATVALGLLLVAERALSMRTLRRARAALWARVVHALLGAELPLGNALEEQDAQGAAVDGVYALSEIAGQRAPAFAADLIAAGALVPLLLSRLPSRVLLVSVAAVAIASMSMVLVLAASVRWAELTERANAVIYDDVAAAVSGRLELVASGADGAFRDRVADHIASWQRLASRESLQTWFAGRVPALAALLIGGLAVLADAATRGALASAVLGDAVLLASVAPTLAGVPHGAFGIVRALVVSRPALEILWTPAAPPPASPRAPAVPATIAWEGVSFCYPARDGAAPEVLHRVSGRWAPGTVLALQGPNGAGKSTLLRLILGVGRPSEGRLLIGDVDSSQIDLRTWRPHVAYLPQRPFFPERGSMRDAVRLLAPEASDDAIRAALVRVELWKAFGARGARDPLDVGVGTLSAGQRQRLALARALCRPARVVLLDEPDANLDAAGVALVGRIVREIAAGGGMVLLAAHTTAIVEAADAVITLEAR
jgi:ABC-type multidrug transport system fused ATPase/permease subunit